MVKIIGGLGNQMFQYATARRVAHVNNVEITLDISPFQNQGKSTPRTYMLDNFNINARIATEKEVRYFIRYKRNHTKILGKIHNTFFADDSIYISEHGYGLNKNVLALKDNVYLDGWWNTAKYFEDIDDIIQKEFTLKNRGRAEYEKTRAEILLRNGVSIHIRRGDYVANHETAKSYGTCDLDYYKHAVEYIVQRTGNPHFYIFSDDIAWAQENLVIPHPHTFMSGKEVKDYEELMLVAVCKHNIIANSTFSWWGAWLNTNKNKIVVAPKQWFKDESFVPVDLVPRSWVRI